MKTFLVVVITTAVTWITVSFIDGVHTRVERLWLISAIKAPGRMALGQIQADLNAGRYALAKAEIDTFMDTWQRFYSGPDSFRGLGIGDIMVSFSKLDTNSIVAHPSSAPSPMPRTAANFRSVTTNMTLQQVMDGFGMYDRVRGSGISRYEYDFADGSAMLLSPEWPFSPTNRIMAVTFYQSTNEIKLYP